MKTTLSLGLLSDPLTEQLKEFQVDQEKLKLFERMHENINFLTVHQIISGLECNKARKRLITKIQKALRE